MPDYSIGYKKPPKSTQFQPGQSGNPKGRPKGTKNLVNDLEEELAEKIQITEGGQSLTISKQRAMLKALLAKALKGDPRAANALIQLKLGLEHLQQREPQDTSLSDDDQQLLDAYIDRLNTSTSQSDGDDNHDNNH